MDKKNFRCRIEAELLEPVKNTPKSLNVKCVSKIDIECSGLDLTLFAAAILNGIMEDMNEKDLESFKATLVGFLMFPEAIMPSRTVIDLSKLRKD